MLLGDDHRVFHHFCTPILLDSSPIELKYVIVIIYSSLHVAYKSPCVPVYVPGKVVKLSSW